MTRLVAALALLTAGVLHADPPRADVPGDAPPGAARRLGATDLRPGSPVVGMALLPGGKQVAVSSPDGLSVWELATDRRVAVADVPAREPARIGTQLPRVPPRSNGRICVSGAGKALVYLRDGQAYRYDLPLAD